MRIKSRPTKVLHKDAEPQIEIKKEHTQVDPLQVYNLRRNLRNSHGDQYATVNIKSDQFDYAKLKRDPEDHLNYVHHEVGDAKKKFKCNQCQYRTNDPIRLTEHKNAHGGIKPNKCEHCDFATSYKSNLYQHRKTHIEIKAHKCDDCGFTTSYKSNLSYHKKSVHGNGTGKIKCSHCDYATWYRGKLMAHVNNIHHGIKDYKCNECKYETSYRSHLGNHMKRMHKRDQMTLPRLGTIPRKSLRTIKRNTRDKLAVPATVAKVQEPAATDAECNGNNEEFELSDKMSCDQCNHVAKTKRRMIEHRNSHLGIKDEKCDNCAFSTSYRHSLRRHIRELHGKYLNKYNEYGTIGNRANKSKDIETKKNMEYKHELTGTYQNSLKEPRKEHNEIKNNKCDECSFTTAYKGNLNQHMSSVHGKEGLHSCPYSPKCQFRKSRPEIILRHIALVHVKDNATTQINDKIILRRSSCEQTAHAKAEKPEEGKGHSENKENKCDHCNFTTAYRGNLNQHVSGVHGFKSYSCTLCNFVTSYRKSFNNHLVVAHAASKWERKEDHMGAKHNKCPECNFITSHKGNLNQHIRGAHGIKNHKCTFCQYATANRENLDKHLEVVHGKRILLDNRNTTDLQLRNNCPVVMLERLSKKLLEKMTFPKSGNGSVLKCNQCEFSTTNAIKLRGHKNAHGKIKANKCEYCDFATSYKSDLSQHRKVHQRDNLFSCPYNPDCDFRNSRFSRMQRHMSKKHLDESTSAKDPNTSIMHKDFHPKSKSRMAYPIHPLAKYKCDECNFSTSLSRSISQHKNAHMGIKNNKCKYCDFATCYKNNLYKHMKIMHAKERNAEVQKENPHRQRRQSVDKEGDKNEGKKYRDCPLCGFSADNQADLNAHLMTNHVAI